MEGLAAESSDNHDNFWEINDAQVNFSQLLEKVLKEGLQKIRKDGKEIAVMLSTEEFKRLLQKDSLVEFFKRAPCQDIELDLSRFE